MFYRIVDRKEEFILKKLLYIFDDINYESGAQKVMLHQIQVLKKDYKISIFSLCKPQNIEQLNDITILGEQVWKLGEILSSSYKDVLKSKDISNVTKIKRILYALAMRFGIENFYLEHYLFRPFYNKFESFDTVIIISEASKLRKFISSLKNPKKIQWIHTDYVLWSKFSEWTRAITRNDSELYQKMDLLVVLSEQNKNKMCERIPQLESKIIVIPNLIDGEHILTYAEKIPSVYVDKSKFCFVTVGRLEQEKALERILNICNQLKQDKKIFVWYLIGTGSQEKKIRRYVKEKGLENYLILIGKLSNPYPIMKQCDCFILLSRYEGRPVTIDEAMVLKLPVIATDVGGIREQFNIWKAGILLKENEKDIYNEIVCYLEQKKRRTTEVSYLSINQEVLKKLHEYL